jgi:hypothetical protein
VDGAQQITHRLMVGPIVRTRPLLA